jgi:uncharacterized protein (DUF2147 family)
MKLPLLLIALALSLATGTAFAIEPTGQWLSESGQTRVEIAPCGGAFCGTIVWVAEDTGDIHNPDPALQGRSLIGIPMIFDMVPDGDRYRGSLYNYTNGKTYSGTLEVMDENTLELEGCVMGLFCRSQTWTRAN